MSHDPEFIHQSEPAQLHKRHRQKGRFRALWVSLLVIVCAWLIVFSIALGQVIASTLDGREQLEQTKTFVLSLAFDEARESLASARQSFVNASNGLVFVKSVSILPSLRDQVDHVDALLVTGQEVIVSIEALLKIAQDLVQLSGVSDVYLKEFQSGLNPTVTFKELPRETKHTMLVRLAASAEELELLTIRIRLANSELKLAREDVRFTAIAEMLDPLRGQLGVVEEQLATLTTLARLLPDFAGLESEKTHLMLLLNNDELRPGGGFVGTYGLMRVKDGEIRSMKTKDIYALDRHSESSEIEAPPAPLQRYNASSSWYMRDGNWSPDFAVSSLKLIEQFIAESRRVPAELRSSVPTAGHIDGVIGFTPDFVARLLSITGPLEVSGQRFAADNVAQLIEYQVEKGFASDGIPFSQRKEILSDLVLAMQQKLFSLPVSRWSEVFAASSEAFQSKELFLYSAQTATEEVISAVGWGGRVQPPTGDVQLVVDANLASLKSDPVVKRSLKYEMFVNSSGQHIGRTTISYVHQGSFDWRTTRYRTYTRLHVPKGSEFIRAQGTLLDDKIKNPSGASGKVDVFEDLGFTVFGAFTSIEPGTTGELVFEYALAPSVVASINAGTYELSVLKQNGARDYPLTLGLNFGKNVSHAVPAEAKINWGDRSYTLNTILEHDLRFDVSL